MIAIPTDIYDKDGNLVRIEVTNSNGEHIADFLWDARDEQTSENRTKFREWVYNFLTKNKQFEVVN